MELISIIIACYNNDATIERAINSALSQDWNYTEIIIVDDCSTDNSQAIISRIASNLQNVKFLVHSTNLGYPSALNTGISASSDPTLLSLIQMIIVTLLGYLNKSGVSTHAENLLLAPYYATQIVKSSKIHLSLLITSLMR